MCLRLLPLEALEFLLTVRYFVGFSEVKRLLFFLLLACERDWRGFSMEEHQKQTVLDLPKVIAVGIASPVATLLTSRFGIAGTLIGLALSAVIITVMVDVLKVYLARASHTAVAKVPSSFRAAPLFRPNVRGRLKVVFYRFYSLPLQRRRSILRGGCLSRRALLHCRTRGGHSPRAWRRQKSYLLGVERVPRAVFF